MSGHACVRTYERTHYKEGRTVVMVHQEQDYRTVFGSLAAGPRDVKDADDGEIPHEWHVSMRWSGWHVTTAACAAGERRAKERNKSGRTRKRNRHCQSFLSPWI